LIVSALYSELVAHLVSALTAERAAALCAAVLPRVLAGVGAIAGQRARQICGTGQGQRLARVFTGAFDIAVETRRANLGGVFAGGLPDAADRAGPACAAPSAFRRATRAGRDRIVTARGATARRS